MWHKIREETPNNGTKILVTDRTSVATAVYWGGITQLNLLYGQSIALGDCEWIYVKELIDVP